MKLLPDNPTQFDYLHAIRAAASRGGSLSRIYQLADEGMFSPQPKAAPRSLYHNMNTDPHTPTATEEGHPCKGHPSFFRSLQPANNYHPAQIAYLMERKLYTGRLIQDVTHLPENLKWL